MRTPGGRDVVEQARKLVETLHLDAVALQVGAQTGEVVGVDRTGRRPGDVGQVREDAGQIDGRSAATSRCESACSRR